MFEDTEYHRMFVAIAFEINEDPDSIDGLRFDVERQSVSPLGLDVITNSQPVDRVGRIDQDFLNWQNRGTRSNNF